MRLGWPIMLLLTTNIACASPVSNLGVKQRVQAGPAPIANFVCRRHWTFPHKKAVQYSSADLPKLLHILADSEYQSCWSSTVKTLGWIAGEGVIPALINFVENGVSGELTEQPGAAAALPMSLTALGVAINQGVPSADTLMALKYLKNATRQSWWERSSIEWGSQKPSAKNYKGLMVKAAVSGLVFTGKQAAIDHLDAIANDGAWVEEFGTKLGACFIEGSRANAQKIAQSTSYFDFLSAQKDELDSL